MTEMTTTAGEITWADIESFSPPTYTPPPDRRPIEQSVRIAWQLAVRLAFLVGDPRLGELYTHGTVDGAEISEGRLRMMIIDFINDSEQHPAAHTLEQHYGNAQMLIDRYRMDCDIPGKRPVSKILSSFDRMDDIVTVIQHMLEDIDLFRLLYYRLDDFGQAAATYSQAKRDRSMKPVYCDTPPVTGYYHRFTPADIDTDPQIERETFHRAGIVLARDVTGKVYLETCFPER